ncbi:Cbb3-type cytochrome oxidase component FixQ [Solimonas aquatica]|uniref:Cbb3-type cytochrome oxidase component FixQ n=1 Tax=Solimonas aquatica TaxID=489703 RepID=A0A1H8ZMN3_9GAMM|nr:cbb3-type cytochrome c oxidase subunit 3 [Solimonas aquatica]SEP65574.1 Cbb3-type cytochrome oxidase component FixQ [Solimonas aquatica]
MSAGIFTLISFVSFICICIWAWSRHNRARFAEAAQLPLGDDELPPCCRGHQAAKTGNKTS